MTCEDNQDGLIDLGVASDETRGAWHIDEDTEGGRMPFAGLIEE